MCSPLTHLLGSLGVIVVYELVLRMNGWVVVRKEDADEMLRKMRSVAPRGQD